MKKLVFIILSVFFLFFLFTYLIISHLPSITSYAFSKLLNGEVTISKIDILFDQGVLSLNIRDIKMRGEIDGEAKDLLVEINVKNGLYIKKLSISNFKAKIPEIKGDGQIPINSLKGDVYAKNGVIQWKKETYILDEMFLHHSGEKEGFTFKLT